MEETKESKELEEETIKGSAKTNKNEKIVETGQTASESVSLGKYDKPGFKEITMEKPREIDATGIKRPWKMDKNGYFLIRVNFELDKIEAAYCDPKDNKVKIVIRGDTPVEVYTTILKKDLVSLMDHAADLGVELEKAYIALKENRKYTQDKQDLESH